jgi:hypothetical protein
LIILGVILLIIGFITKIAIVWTIGIIAVVAGIIWRCSGWPSRGRRTQTLLLAAGPDPAFVLEQEGGTSSAWIWAPGNATVRLPSRCAGRLA